MKKIISLFLALLTIMSISVTAAYAETPAVTGKCGDNATYTYDGKTETLIIEGTGEMYDYLDWFNMGRYLSGKSYSKEYPVQPEPFRIARFIKISDGITVIGKNAFSRHYNAKDIKVEVDFGKTVKKISDGAFYRSYITNLVIPDSVTTIGEGAFYFCKIENLELGSSVKYIKKEAFSDNPYLKSIIIPDGVVSIAAKAFYGCNNAEYIELGKKVKTVGARAFIHSENDGSADDAYTETRAKKVRYIVPETVTKIGKYAFGYEDEDEGGGYLMKDFVVVGKVGSAAYKYCEKYAVGFDDADGCEKDAHIWGNKHWSTEKVCRKTAGIYATQCIKCGARRYEKGRIWDHDFAEETTKTVKNPTYFKEGKKKTYCTTCKKYITEKTPKKSIESKINVSFDGKKTKIKYTKIKNADGFQIKYYGTKKEVTKTFNTTKSVTKTITLPKGTDYIYVRAFNKTDSGKLYSDWVYAPLK